MKYSLVDPEYIHIVWSDVKPYIDKACSYGFGQTTSDIHYRLLNDPCTRLLVIHKENQLSGIYVLDKLDDTMCLTNISFNLPKITKVKLTPDEIREVLDFVKQLSKEMGCKLLMGIGRKGWTRYSKQYGFVTVSNNVYEFSLEEK